MRNHDVRKQWSAVALAVAVAAGAYAPAARAAFTGLANVDFNRADPGNPASPTMTGAAVIGQAGDAWNGIGEPAFSSVSLTNAPLVDSAGAASAAQLSFTTTEGAYDVGTGGNAFGATPYAPLMRDYLYSYGANATTTVTLSGLTAGARYDLYLYSESNDPARQTAFTLGGQTLVAASSSADGTFIAGKNFVEFSTTADVSGDVAFSFAAANGSDEGDLNGLQLQYVGPAVNPGGGGAAVPLPMAAWSGLGTIAVAGLLATRARRRGGSHATA